jgi:hypothetical protein
MRGFRDPLRPVATLLPHEGESLRTQRQNLRKFLSAGDESDSRRAMQVANDCNLGVASSSGPCFSSGRDRKTCANREHGRVLCGYRLGSVVPLLDRSSRYCVCRTAFCSAVDLLWSDRARLPCGIGNLRLTRAAARGSNMRRLANGVGAACTDIARRRTRLADKRPSSKLSWTGCVRSRFARA